MGFDGVKEDFVAHTCDSTRKNEYVVPDGLEQATHSLRVVDRRASSPIVRRIVSM